MEQIFTIWLNGLTDISNTNTQFQKHVQTVKIAHCCYSFAPLLRAAYYTHPEPWKPGWCGEV